MRYSHACWLIACAIGCGDNAPESSPGCDLEGRVAIEVQAEARKDDGSVALHGAVRFAPVVGDPGAAAERAVYAVYVADQEVLPAASEFNFRSWSITLTADRLTAFTTTAADGSQQARLPVWAYLHGGCVLELPEAEQPVIEISAPTSTRGVGER